MSVRQNSTPAAARKTRSSSRGTTAPRRQSNRVRKNTIAASPRLPTPASSPPPPYSSTDSDAGSRTTTATNTRRSTPTKTCYTAGTPQQPTVNWDCVSYVVSDQKIHSTYSKPNASSDPARVSSYGKLVTKTVTMTVTTTIATTEILQPGESGYEASLARQKSQAAEAETQYRNSRAQAAGAKDAHEAFHASHHRAARPAPAMLAKPTAA
ncbi:hypothetical protein EDC01DRAFT_627728 [Geopyxis carbonaria]|nr:hypothetical protein EDC01DRAFT_627728 [Geopyxis carbonaria]